MSRSGPWSEGEEDELMSVMDTCNTLDLVQLTFNLTDRLQTRDKEAIRKKINQWRKKLKEGTGFHGDRLVAELINQEAQQKAKVGIKMEKQDLQKELKRFDPGNTTDLSGVTVESAKAIVKRARAKHAAANGQEAPAVVQEKQDLQKELKRLDPRDTTDLSGKSVINAKKYVKGAPARKRKREEKSEKKRKRDEEEKQAKKRKYWSLEETECLELLLAPCDTSHGVFPAWDSIVQQFQYKNKSQIINKGNQIKKRKIKKK